MGHLHLQGCGTALVTPFKNGEVDYEALGRILEIQKASGVHFLVPLGSTAETPCLSPEEKVGIVRFIKERCPGMPLVVGAGTNSLTGTLANIRLLEPLGPDAFLVVVPYYNKPTQDGIYAYFKAVSEATSRDIVLYNVPGRTGTNMTAQTTLRLAEIPSIVAVKEASSKYAQIAEIIRCRPEGFSVLSGNDDETLSLMASGADGIISVASNVAPAPVAALAQAMLDGDLPKARALLYRLLPLYRNCFVESNPIPAKGALSLLGLARNELRLPLTPATDATLAIMEQTLRDLGML